MARLYVLSGPDLGRSFEIRPGDTLGRNQDCIVTLRDASISRAHAHIEESGGVWFLVDDRSRNGISAGGVRQERLLLVDGLELKVGEVALRFRQSEPATAPARGATTPPPETASREDVLASKPPSVPPALAAGPSALDIEDEIEIDSEPEIEIGVGGGATARSQPPPKPRASPSPAPPAAGRGRSGTLPTRAGPTGPSVRQVSGTLLQYHKVEAHGGGILGAELSQMPWWQRAALVLLALAVAAGIFALAYWGLHLWGASTLDPQALADEPPALDQPSGN